MSQNVVSPPTQTGNVPYADFLKNVQKQTSKQAILDMMYEFDGGICAHERPKTRPTFVAIGEQSHGKSRFVMRLMELGFLPMKSGICTRCPILIQIRRCEVDEEENIILILPRGFPDTGNRINIHKKQDTFRIDEEMEIREVIDGYFQQRFKNDSYGTDEITIVVKKRRVLIEMDLVDLPGYSAWSERVLKNEERKKSFLRNNVVVNGIYNLVANKDISTIDKIVSKYVNREDSIVVLVHSGMDDLGTNHFLPNLTTNTFGINRLYFAITYADSMNSDTISQRMKWLEEHDFTYPKFFIANGEKPRSSFLEDRDYEMKKLDEKPEFKPFENNFGITKMRLHMAEDLSKMMNRFVGDMRKTLKTNLTTLEKNRSKILSDSFGGHWNTDVRKAVEVNKIFQEFVRNTRTKEEFFFHKGSSLSLLRTKFHNDIHNLPLLSDRRINSMVWIKRDIMDIPYYNEEGIGSALKQTIESAKETIDAFSEDFVSSRITQIRRYCDFSLNSTCASFRTTLGDFLEELTRSQVPQMSRYLLTFLESQELVVDCQLKMNDPVAIYKFLVQKSKNTIQQAIPKIITHFSVFKVLKDLEIRDWMEQPIREYRVNENESIPKRIDVLIREYAPNENIKKLECDIAIIKVKIECIDHFMRQKPEELKAFVDEKVTGSKRKPVFRNERKLYLEVSPPDKKLKIK